MARAVPDEAAGLAVEHEPLPACGLDNQLILARVIVRPKPGARPQRPKPGAGCRPAPEQRALMDVERRQLPAGVLEEQPAGGELKGFERFLGTAPFPAR